MNVIKEFNEAIDNKTDIVAAYSICKEKTSILSSNAISIEEKDDAAAQGLMLMMWLAYYSLTASKEEQKTINKILYPFNLLSKTFIVISMSNAIIYVGEDKEQRYKRSTKYLDTALIVLQSIAHILKGPKSVTPPDTFK